MKLKWSTLAILATFSAALAAGYGTNSPLTVSSPDGRLQAVFSTDDGGMRWSLLRDGKTLVKPSAMGCGCPRVPRRKVLFRRDDRPREDHRH